MQSSTFDNEQHIVISTSLRATPNSKIERHMFIDVYCKYKFKKYCKYKFGKYKKIRTVLDCLPCSIIYVDGQTIEGQTIRS